VTRRVYIVNNGGHNYSDAERFGEVVFCTEHVIRKDDVSSMYRQLSDSLADAKLDDFLLVSCLTSVCMVAAAILADQFGELHLLIFKDGKYEPRDLILSN
jgi:hypothetical protein